ncbi:DNA methyl transferase [Bacillus sp. TS-2]|nr:DNA methyl transferase [Bacillus sp. TS-2]
MFKENTDFYPTPKELQIKMLNKIDWKNVKTCLEPSAGKGDLVEGIIKQSDDTRNYRVHKLDIDTIEKDENLVHLLKSKGHRVIASDFLTFQTYKSYDCIVANFPFSEGDKHALQALNLLENQTSSSQIVFIINAETLRNPYSNSRKELIQKLEKYNADIEFIEDAFLKSERSTKVTIAMVSLKIVNEEYNSSIINELKNDKPNFEKQQNTSNQIISADFIEGIVSQYNYEIKIGLKLINEYNSLKPLMLRSFSEDKRPVLKLSLEYEDNEGSDLQNAYIKQIRLKYWTTLFQNEKFTGLLTTNLRRKYMSYVQELKDYDFSLYNIDTIKIQMDKEMVQGLEDTILNLFEEFSHKHYYDESSKNIHLYNGWKTNKSYKINKKVIIPLNGFSNWFENRFNPTDYEVVDKLKDIEKVFNYLDNGLTEQVDLSNALASAESNNENKKIELKYFYVTFYKKGTCHIEFKDKKILHKFNLYGSQKKGWLPPSYGEVNFSNMTTEEKQIINAFEGEQSYKKVINDKDYYFIDTGKLLKLTS